MGTEASPAGKVWDVLNSLGSMAFAAQFGIMTLEVQVSKHFDVACIKMVCHECDELCHRYRGKSHIQVSQPCCIISLCTASTLSAIALTCI